jgi:hypothetical protein
MVDVFAEKNVEFCGGIGGLKEEYVPELTLKQKIWLRNTFREYFSCKYTSCKNFFYIDHRIIPIEKFNDYLRFADDKRFTALPEHLKLVDGINSIGLDFPEMLGHQPFLGLIREDRLEEIQDKVRQGFCDIISESLEEIEVDFHANFRQRIKSAHAYNEYVPELFLKKLRDYNILGEYDDKRNRFIWDFSRISSHRPPNIYEAYERFAHSVYTLRLFWKEKEPTDYETLFKWFNQYLGGFEKHDVHLHVEADLPRRANFPFYRRLLQKYWDYEGIIMKTKEPLSEEFLEKVEYNTNLLRAHVEMVEKALQTAIGRQALNIPTDREALISRIRKQSNKPWLLKQDSKHDSDFTDTERGTIGENFNTIAIILSSEYLSKKSKEILANACISKRGGDIHVIKNAIYEILHDPDNREFLCEPYVEGILTKDFIGKLENYDSIDNGGRKKTDIKIREKFDQIAVILASELLSEKSRESLEKWGSIKIKKRNIEIDNKIIEVGGYKRKKEITIYDKINTLYQLSYGSDKEFLCHPYVKKFLSEKFKEDLRDYKKRKPVSLNEPIVNSEGGETDLGHILEHTITGKKIEDEVEMEIIRKGVKNKVAEESVDDFALYVKILLNKYAYFPDKLREKVNKKTKNHRQEESRKKVIGKLIDVCINSLLDHYFKLRRSKKIPDRIIEVLKKKLEEILRDIIKKIEEKNRRQIND